MLQVKVRQAQEHFCLFEVNDNGTYYVYAQEYFKIAHKIITINNLDKIPPTFETSYNDAIEII